MSDNEDRSDKNGNSPPAESPSEKPELQRALATIFGEAGIDLPVQSLETLSAIMSFQGPLPPPNMLRDYGQVVPGLEIRIIEAWEREQTHSQDTQKSIVKSSKILNHTGQWMGFVIALAGLGAAIYLAPHGQWAAGVIGAAALGVVSIISLFRARRNR